MGIKIIKENKVRDYTFIDKNLDLQKAKDKEPSKKDKAERDYRLRDDSKLDKLKHKSKMSGGHSMQGHSPIYE